MNKSIGGFVVCLLGLVACNVEHYDDCTGDSFDYGDDSGGSTGPSRADAGSSSGKTSTGGGAAGSAAAGGSAPDGAGGDDSGTAGSSASGGTGPVVVPPPHCDEESDCKPGFNCDLETQQCLPSDEETCGELKTEAVCTHRSDCTPIYAGTNCSCGQDCECKGGEPGCVCESFGFFGCS